jgi:SAM-dependent methyltransferase
VSLPAGLLNLLGRIAGFQNSSSRLALHVDTVEELIAEGLEAPVRGWDFSWLNGRAEETRPPWDYPAIVREVASSSRRMLDVDTGGGEFLSRLAPFPGSVVATEGYAPNLAVANERLGPLGIPVVEAVSAPDNVDQGETSPETSRSGLPFAADAFDLVIDRHASYWPSEIHRVLRDGGRFVTQQRSEAGTGGTAWEDLFARPPHAHRRFDKTFAVGQLTEAGFDVARAEEADTPVTFHDLSAVVFYLRIVPWAVDGFDPFGDRETLDRIHQLIRDEGSLRIAGSHMLLHARAL